jgi:MFS family permease
MTLSADADKEARRDEVSSAAAHPFAVLRDKKFVVFWLAALVSNTGGWISNLTVPFVLFQITGSAVWVGYFSVAAFVPALLLGPVGGIIADRFDRRRVLIVTQSAASLSALALWSLWQSGVRDPGVILIPVVFAGICQGLNLPSWQSFVHDLVARKDLRAAVTLNSVQFNAARALGPLLGGVILISLGPGFSFAMNFLSYGFVVVALFLVRAREPQVFAVSRVNPAREFQAALKYIPTQPGIAVGIIGSVIVGVLGQPVFSLTVVLAKTVYRVDEFQFGLLNVSLGVGAILAVPLLAGSGGRVPLSRAITWGMMGCGVGLTTLSVVGTFPFALPVLVFTGASLILCMAGTNTAIQLIVRDSMRGRVLSIRQVAFMASIPVGALLGGIVSDWIGVQPFLLFCGIGLFVAIGVLLLLPGRVMTRIDDRHDAEFRTV